MKNQNQLFEKLKEEKAFNQWSHFLLSTIKECGTGCQRTLLVDLTNGYIMLQFRDNRESSFLYHAFSQDYGRTWNLPERTNFPDAKFKFSGLRLMDGWYVIVSNSDLKKLDS